MCFTRITYTHCPHTNIITVPYSPSIPHERSQQQQDYCSCPNLVYYDDIINSAEYHNIDAEYCPPCKRYHTDAGFYRKKWERAIAEMEDGSRKTLEWIAQERTQKDPTDSKHNMTLSPPSSPCSTTTAATIKLLKHELDELYKAENGPALIWPTATTSCRGRSLSRDFDAVDGRE
ncbi:hypothetical protein TWF730_003697 [Orbilia blumenaviensis]|uniref:Uncharacterized protein n=1 Tax=Orbilia blumenaviensis TaxID=1796055 RepID=A0AAV9U386_9PEZI